MILWAMADTVAGTSRTRAVSSIHVENDNYEEPLRASSLDIRISEP